MIDKLEKQQARYQELEQLLCDPHVLNDQKRYRELNQEFADLSELIATFQSYKELLSEIQNTKEMVASEEDAALKTLAREELKELEEQKTVIEKQLHSLLTPCDPMDSKNVIVEIRAGTGGEEATLFACDLFRLYSRYAENQGWKLEIIDANPNELGGYKEIIFSISGKNVFGHLRWESGGHRVQRIPLTEANGRIQTSAATVAVFPEAEETDVELLDKDIKIDIFRSSGPGGQSVNTTDSAVRVTHLPTGLVATCQDEKSQLKNKQKALKVLRARLLEMEASKKAAERSAERKSQVGSGDRSDRIRTYNFPQNRLTDHRANLSFYHLDRIMEGELIDVIEALKLRAQKQDF